VVKVFGLTEDGHDGDTVPIAALVGELGRRGLSVSVIRRVASPDGIDRPGKDSYRHRMAGAAEVMVTSAKRWALMHGHDSAPEISDLIGRLAPVDVVLVEGFDGAPGVPPADMAGDTVAIADAIVDACARETD
jgi:molybdopterin-guanine dinucleotide biosynthesis protein B